MINSIPSWLPIWLIFIGAIFAAAGGFLQNRLQSKRSAESSEQIRQLNAKLDESQTQLRKVVENAAKHEDLIKDIAARSGNEAQLRSLINERSQRLNADPKLTASLLADLLAQVPQQATDYRKMQNEQQDVIAQRTRAYLLSWEPLMRLVLSEVDQTVALLNEKGFAATLARSEAPFTQPNTNSSYAPRRVVYKTTRIDVQLNNAGVGVDRFDDAYFFVRVISEGAGQPGSVVLEAMTLRIGEQNAELNGKTYPRSDIGIPPKELVDGVRVGIAKAFQRMLAIVEANSKDSK